MHFCSQISRIAVRGLSMFSLEDPSGQQPIIKVIGVGSAGGNAVAHLVDAGIEGVDCIYVHTSYSALKRHTGITNFLLGENVARGLGVGGNPDLGRQAAIEDRERLREMLVGADMVFIATGMGGGTGSGAAPVIAQLAMEMGILTIALVFTPLPSEGRKRAQIALQGIEALSRYVDSLVTIPNELLISVLGREITMRDAFSEANGLLLVLVRGIVDLILRPGLINVDFADVRTLMSDMGKAMMGSGTAKGGHRAVNAVELAINNPLFDTINLAHARGILVNVTTGTNFTMREYDEIGQAIHGFANENANVLIGTVLDPEMSDAIRVTVVATGLDGFRAVKQSAPSICTKAPPDASYDYLDIPAFLRRQAQEAEALAIDTDSIRIVAHPDISDRSLALLVELLSALYAGASNDVLVVSRAGPIPSRPTRRGKPGDKADPQTAAGM